MAEPEKIEQPASKLEAVAAILSGEVDEVDPSEQEGKPKVEAKDPDSESEAEDEAKAEGDEKPEAEDVLITDLAKKLDVEPSDLYAMKVAIDGREPISIGELKDAYAGNLESFETEREQFRNEQMQARAHIGAILSALPQVPPEVVQQIQTIQQESVEKEYNALISVLPEWKDTAVYQADRNAIIDHLKPYGFRAGDFDGVTDHRLMKYVRDNMARERRAREVTKPIPKVPSKPTHSEVTKKDTDNAARARLFKAAKAGNRDAQLAGVVDILKNG